MGEVTNTLKALRTGEHAAESLRLLGKEQAPAAAIFAAEPTNTFFGINAVPSMSADIGSSEAAVLADEVWLHEGDEFNIVGSI